jgi:hypothetical protein
MRTPREGDHVSIPTHQATFVVVEVRKTPTTVDLKMVNADHVEKDVPWGVLIYQSESTEDVNQAAARVVREATERD